MAPNRKRRQDSSASCLPNSFFSCASSCTGRNVLERRHTGMGLRRGEVRGDKANQQNERERGTTEGHEPAMSGDFVPSKVSKSLSIA